MIFREWILGSGEWIKISKKCFIYSLLPSEQSERTPYSSANKVSELPTLYKRGFTLLETLISLAIIALALTVILKNQFYNLKLCSESKNMLVAEILAREKMAEIDLFGAVEREQGVFRENQDFSWVLDFSEIEKNLKEVNLKVIWKEGKLAKDFSVTTYLLATN
ncbi:MAG: hypothetical protein COZ37_07025 [bacterium (Candidatus Ratteibacteria) CG_4_10_14_3_um_filter_41_18]|uniref:Type II secretion system protein GspI C-terminal domain-containing protein n=1 Tax=bacterium (Candidatus Ratteibacteria) CG_4_10_14_3_um_filter_41_18 TaxID=2014287 RepID=A0A2M7M1M6_9BACT|nr:MAG: hypothetical protein COZ37_07025 [bacterium (Candidatus Ratteibacteria) CG_4_10_14_3_um_filter_41_18]